ncbi:hypothetical protein KAK07_19790 [Ideonella sp. 4Y16]|uniref:hypothetical protein n=1 Tax=Ideonella alba TaxID=2824118 RepID=UPI001B37D3BA|nr:hypothetical protein [Ideonella alba]MBQ0945592.1 hypothetical protein [Ideonella alba]
MGSLAFPKTTKPAEAGFALCARPEGQAALSHIAVSKALLIIGMFMPKFGLIPFLAAAFAAGFVASWAVSAARSHDPFSWERATEKNRNI